MRIEILIGGIGGQGVVYAANLLGRAASQSYKYVATSASYGPESRGTLTSSEVVVSDQFIDYPHCEFPKYLIAMHQKAYDTYATKIDPEGIIIIDSSLVTPDKNNPRAHYTIPATMLAREKIGNITLSNLILVGLFCKTIGIVSEKDLVSALSDMTSKASFSSALKALELGLRNE